MRVVEGGGGFVGESLETSKDRSRGMKKHVDVLKIRMTYGLRGE